MNTKVLELKSASTLLRVAEYLEVGEYEKARQKAKTLVIIHRMLARNAVNKLLLEIDAKKDLVRSIKDAEQKGIHFIAPDKMKNRMSERVIAAKKNLAGIGGMLIASLDLWQSCGATLQEFCNICNRDYDRFQTELQDNETNFAKIAFVHNPDFKSGCEFLDYRVDAPITHAIKEHILDEVINSDEMKRAAHEAIKEIFPDLFDNAMTLYTDDDGVEYLFDSNEELIE